MDAVVRILTQYFTCNVASLPATSYTHPYLRLFRTHMTSLSGFISCIREHHMMGFVGGPCRYVIKNKCGQQFNPSSNQTDFCYKRLWDSSGPELDEDFTTYHKCLAHAMQRLTPCLQLFQKACVNKSVIAVKTVRATMREAGELLSIHPNLKVIHLLRDPRHVTASRLRKSWSRGAYEGSGIYARTGQAYCQTALEDQRYRRKLESQYPDRLMVINYENITDNPTTTYQNIYSFLNIKPHSLYNLTSHLEKAAELTTKRKSLFSPKIVAGYSKVVKNKYCKSLNDETGSNWFPDQHNN